MNRLPGTRRRARFGTVDEKVESGIRSSGPPEPVTARGTEEFRAIKPTRARRTGACRPRGVPGSTKRRPARGAERYVQRVGSSAPLARPVLKRCGRRHPGDALRGLDEPDKGIDHTVALLVLSAFGRGEKEEALPGEREVKLNLDGPRAGRKEGHIQLLVVRGAEREGHHLGPPRSSDLRWWRLRCDLIPVGAEQVHKRSIDLAALSFHFDGSFVDSHMRPRDRSWTCGTS